MRRFDAKMHLRPPTAEHLHRMLGTVANSLRLAPPSMEVCRSLAGMAITPGDVAAVSRRVRHVPLADGQAQVEAVKAEGQFKPGTARGGMSFVWKML